jgi:FAT domain
VVGAASTATHVSGSGSGGTPTAASAAAAAAAAAAGDAADAHLASCMALMRVRERPQAGLSVCSSLPFLVLLYTHMHTHSFRYSCKPPCCSQCASACCRCIINLDPSPNLSKPFPPSCAQAATEYGANWPKAWHHWSLFNCGLLEAHHKRGDGAAAAAYVAPAVTGFFRRCDCWKARVWGWGKYVFQDLVHICLSVSKTPHSG